MRIKNYRHIIFFFVLGVVTLASYLWFVKSEFFPAFLAWAQSNSLLYYIILVISKITGIVWPPLPGGVFTLGSIPILGWFVAYSADLIGSMVGSTIAYFIARKYGISFIRKIFDDEVIAKFQKIKIKKEREIESIFVFRLFGGNIVELFCYGAGILRVNYFNYIIASFLSHFVIGIPTFYLIRNILSGKGIFVSILFAVILVILFFTLKHRYFEIEE